MTSKKANVAKHLTLAKRAVAQGDASFRSAANHIAAAIKAGATQAEAAAKVGKSQPWVNRLLKWRENGFKEGGPFADDHARAIISGANNPASQTVPTEVTNEDESALDKPVPEPPASNLVHLNITTEPPKKPVDYSEELAAMVPLLAKVAQLEQVATELATEIQLRGGVIDRESVRERIRAVASTLLSSVERPPMWQVN